MRLSATMLALPIVQRVSLGERLATLRGGVEVLLVTATATEKNAVLRRMAPFASEARILKGALGPATYYVGRLGEHGVALTMCRMGAVGSHRQLCEQDDRHHRAR